MAVELGELGEVRMNPDSFAQNHTPVNWEETLLEPGCKASEAPFEDKVSIVARVGLITLGSGTGSWRVREAMNRIARLLGIKCHADISLLGIEASFTQGRETCSRVVTLRTAGVNTNRIWKIEQFVRDAGNLGRDWTVGEFHERLDAIEHEKGAYSSLQVGLAAAFACGAFVFLLGGGASEMLCAAIGAGLGNFVRSKMLGRKLNQMFSVGVGVAVACLGFFAAIKVLELCFGISFENEAGYIGAMLFVIPGFPLIESGLDIAKLDMRSGLERFAYALTIIVIATLVGWIVALIVGLEPGELTQPEFSPELLLVLRLIMTFVGVFGFSIMFNSPVKMAALAGFVGAVANTLRLTLQDMSVPPEIAALLGATTAGLLAWTFIAASDKLGKPHFPRVSLTVPSIVIMVPGLYMYQAMYYLAAFDTVSALDWAFRAGLIVVFLPIGLAIARILTDPRWRYDT